MRKIIFPWFLALLIAALPAGQLAASTSKAIALTLKVEGSVTLIKAKTTKKMPLRFGTPLDDGDKSLTGEDGAVVLVFADDKSQITLRPNTQATIEGKRDQQSNITKRVSMEVGRLFAKVEKQRGSLEIATPTSVASVKGTECWVVVLEDGTTEVYTIEGIVELLNKFSGRTVVILPGQVGTSTPDGGNDVGDADPGDVPGDGDTGGEEHSIEIEVEDPDGSTRIIRIQYQE